MTDTLPDCYSPDVVSGALTYDDLLAILCGSADSAYLDPIISAGVGNGFEVYEQAIMQLVRVSEAIERTVQGLMLRAWSGQTGAHACSGRAAQVPLRFSRTKYANLTIIFDPRIRIGEIEVDAGENAGVDVAVERFFLCETPVVWNAGDTNDHCVRGIAESIGYGYNNCRPYSLRNIEFADTAASNTDASVIVSDTSVKLVCAARPDVLRADMLGQYVRVTAGLNAGRTGRIISYESPGSSDGGSVEIERLFVVRCVVVGPRLVFGEIVTQPATGASGTVCAQYDNGVYAVLSIVLTSAAVPVVGAGMSLIDATLSTIVLLDPGLFPDICSIEYPAWETELGTASWSILSWNTLSVSCTNPVMPAGGRAGFLEALGRERGVDKLAAETDDEYRLRITSLADVVSPMSIRRAICRVCADSGITAEMLEVGTPEFPGFFYDVEVTYAPTWSFAYDTSRTQDRWKTFVSVYEMRAFFVIEVLPSGFGEFGFAFDLHPTGAWDAAPYPAFFDGYPLNTANALKRIWQQVEAKRAAGVAFVLHLNT